MNKSFSKNKRLKYISPRNKRGVALVFTLGILGLLAVLALGFASTALLNRKISENTSNTVYAQNLARSIALARVVYGVENGLDLSKLYSYSDSAYKDWLFKLETYLNGTKIYTYDPTSNVRWQYIKGSDNKLVGRYAYVVVQDKGRLDPSINVDDVTASGIIGSSEKEVGINSPTWSGSPGFLNKAVSGNYRWATFGEVFNQLSTNITADKKKTFFTDGVNIGQIKSPETYWVDTTTNTGIKDENELYLRFNLYRTDWESSVANPMTPEKLVGEDPTGTTETQISGSSKKSIDFIPWLKNWNFQRDATYWKKDIMAKQIAANIIQYNRPESDPTVSDSSDWSATAPTYAGVGKHPMLNELGFKFNVQATLTPKAYPNETSPTAYDYTLIYSFTVSFGVELIDMFQSLSVSTDRKTSEITLPTWAVKATYTWLPGGNGQVFNSFGQFQTATDSNTPFDSSTEATVGKTHSIDGSVWWNVPYTPATSFWEDYNVTKTVTFRINIGSDCSTQIINILKIKGISIVPGNAVLKYDSIQRDFATLPSSSTDATEYDATEERTFSFALETADPRVNHYPTDWVGVPDTSVSSTPTNDLQTTTTAATNYFGSSGSKNSFALSITPITGEAVGVNDPAYTGSSRLSTSYIRHGQMKSLWELGCISRAEAWKTLNLSQKDIPSPPSAATPYSPDYSYAKGDATLFDQVKLNGTDERLKYGKVNINTNVHQVWEALLASSKLIYKKDLHTGTGNDLLSAGTADATILKIIKISDTPTTPHTDCLICSILDCTSIYSFQNRADLLIDPTKVSYLPGYNSTKHSTLEAKLTAMQTLLLQSATTPKIEREEVISKIMPLLKTEPLDMVYVIVLAQTIRDIGGTPAYVDWNGDGDYTDTFTKSDTAVMKKAGYGDTGAYAPSDISLSESYSTTAIGTYEIGADKITSEAKLIAVLVQDPVTRKWRIARYQYVE